MTAGVVVAGVLGTALVAFVLWGAFRPVPEPPKQTAIRPAEQSSPATAPAEPSSPAADATASAEPTAPAEPVTSPAGFTRAPKIAYRLGGTIYVAAEDGTGAKKAVSSPYGPYALSPDGATLAFVDDGVLKLVDVEQATAKTVGAAEAALPVWRPDSSAVLFVRLEPKDAMHVWEARRDGSGLRMLSPGAAVSVSPDGSILVVRPDASLTAKNVRVSVDGGAFKDIRIAEQPTAATAVGKRLLVAVVDRNGAASVVSLGLDGKGAATIAGTPAENERCSYTELWPSPDGESVAVVASGDDGYSRVALLKVASGDMSRVTGRRALYMRGWSATGSAFYAVEGNHFQGESTMLVRVEGQGGSRRPVTSGVE